MRKRQLPYPEWMLEEIVDSSIISNLTSIPTTTKILFRCPQCKQEYLQTIHNHIHSDNTPKQGCPYCSKQKRAESYSYTCTNNRKPYPQWFIEELYLEEDKERAKLGNIKSDEQLLFCCPQCNKKYTQRVASHITLSTGEKKKGCPECGIKKQVESSRQTKEIIKQYPQWFIDELYLEEDKEKARKENFYGYEEKQFFCTKHNIVYTKKVRDRIDLKTHLPKSGCPKCNIEKFRKSRGTDNPMPDWFINDLVRKDDKNRASNGEIFSNEHLVFQCDKGHQYTQEVHAHICLGTQGRLSGCPICAKMRSKQEIEVEDYIKSLGIKTVHRRFSSSILSQFEVDIFIPDRNIAIEYNGSYWHKTLPDDGNNKFKFYHNQKFYSLQKLGIRLISIFDIDWFIKKDKIKQYLKDLLLPEIKIKIFARKCIINPITKEQSNNLYNQYHLLGQTTVQSVSYGLFYNNELLSCMSFQKGRYTENNNPVWTLTRFVTKSGYSIVGGASKLLHQFEKEYNPDILLSYSDNDYFSGDLYSKLGFSCLGDTKSPRYYWFLNNREIKREQCQLKHLAKLYPEAYKESLGYNGNKEDYIMLKLGACKVYRSGHTKWIKKYN